MVNVNEFDETNASESQRDTPPEEVLLSELVNADDLNPTGEGVFDFDGATEPRMFTLRMPQHHDSDTTGGDPDDDWYQAEVVGEEAVGGENPTPDQNVTEDLLRSVGIPMVEGESVHTQDKLEARDRCRWELNPESAEDYQERD